MSLNKIELTYQNYLVAVFGILCKKASRIISSWNLEKNKIEVQKLCHKSHLRMEIFLNY